MYEHDGTVFVGSTDQKPLRVPLDGASARFVRVQLPGRTFLHLEEVEVFGVAEPERNLAYRRPADQVSASEWSRHHPVPVPPDWEKRTAVILEQCRRLESEWGIPGELKAGGDWDRFPEHAVPVGNRGSDIDHLVIGPGGVFTLNTKHHPRARVWVGEQQIRVTGQPTHYIRNSLHEAERASRLLSSAVGRDIHVIPVLVFTGSSELSMKRQPMDVHVTHRNRLGRWLTRQRSSLDSASIDRIYAVARRESTWVRVSQR